ncbi:ABC transporter [Halobacteriales archaeon QS_1_68_44]|nr:MAG: ABC transporter [Halobacteriales archaeon QS_1_68_44]
MITLEEVAVELGGVAVLEDVSLSVEAGQFLALVGPNGAGKTTLLRTCNGVLSPDAGTVQVDGRAIASLSARELGRRIATVPQETALPFEFDVEDVVAMGRTPHRSRFRTADDNDREAVRAALERALAQATPALLLDEPTASLDVNHQVRTLSMARDLAEDGRAVVAAIHDLELAARFCDRVALLSEGHLLATGTPEEVLTAGRVESAFDVRAATSTNPATGTRTVTPLSDAPPDGPRVHVVGGGERTARVVGRLAENGVEVTVGVLPAGDVAAATAETLAREVVTAPPFEAVSADRRRAAAELLAAADAAVVAGPLAGPNESLLEGFRPLFALENIDHPPGATPVPEADLLKAVRASPDDAPSVTRT